MAINVGTFIVKNTTPSIESEEVVALHETTTNIKVANFVVKNKPIVTETLPEVEVVVENEEVASLLQVVQMEEGTVIHNGQPKKFNKKMSAYMIDMLTSEE
jgi:hypothetical protein